MKTFILLLAFMLLLFKFHAFGQADGYAVVQPYVIVDVDSTVSPLYVNKLEFYMRCQDGTFLNVTNSVNDWDCKLYNSTFRFYQP